MFLFFTRFSRQSSKSDPLQRSGKTHPQENRSKQKQKRARLPSDEQADITRKLKLGLNVARVINTFKMSHRIILNIKK